MIGAITGGFSMDDYINGQNLIARFANPWEIFQLNALYTDFRLWIESTGGGQARFTPVINAFSALEDIERNQVLTTIHALCVAQTQLGHQQFAANLGQLRQILVDLHVQAGSTEELTAAPAITNTSSAIIATPFAATVAAHDEHAIRPAKRGL